AATLAPVPGTPDACGGSVAPGPDVGGRTRNLERQRQGLAGARSDRPEPVLLRHLERERGAEDAVVVLADTGDRPPLPALAVTALDGHDARVARRVASPDADAALVSVRDEGEAKRGESRLGARGLERVAQEEEAALQRAGAREVLQQVPRHERDAGA